VRKNSGNGGWLTRKITVRREKKGWGVMDIDAPHEFDPLGRIPKRKPIR
jgi:hypothetical protein